MKPSTNRLLAECLGTFGLVFVGCCAIVVNDLYGGTIGHLGVSISFGLIVMAMIYSFGNISGARINPAVTIGFVVAGRFDQRHALPYILSQCAGGILAAAALRLLFPEHATLGMTLPAGAYTQAFGMEVILSFLLMLVILNVSTGHMEKGIMAGVPPTLAANAASEAEAMQHYRRVRDEIAVFTRSLPDHL